MCHGHATTSQTLGGVAGSVTCPSLQGQPLWIGILPASARHPICEDHRPSRRRYLMKFMTESMFILNFHPSPVCGLRGTLATARFSRLEDWECALRMRSSRIALPCLGCLAVLSHVLHGSRSNNHTLPFEVCGTSDEYIAAWTSKVRYSARNIAGPVVFLR